MQKSAFKRYVAGIPAFIEVLCLKEIGIDTLAFVHLQSSFEECLNISTSLF